jgi:hypothetical protein
VSTFGCGADRTIGGASLGLIAAFFGPFCINGFLKTLSVAVCGCAFATIGRMMVGGYGAWFGAVVVTGLGVVTGVMVGGHGAGFGAVVITGLGVVTLVMITMICRAMTRMLIAVLITMRRIAMTGMVVTVVALAVA